MVNKTRDIEIKRFLTYVKVCFDRGTQTLSYISGGAGVVYENFARYRNKQVMSIALNLNVGMHRRRFLVAATVHNIKL